MRGWHGPVSGGTHRTRRAELEEREQRLPNGATHELTKFHYDVAGAANPGALASLLKLVTTTQCFVGHRFPARGPSLTPATSLSQIGFSEADLRAIERDNAVRLLPRLALL